MRHNQPYRVTVVWSQGLPVMVGGQKHVVAIQVGERYVGGESLLGVSEHVRGLGLGLHSFQDLTKAHALPVSDKADPASDAVKRAMGTHRGQTIELLPT